MTEGEKPCFSTFARRLVHYLHTSFVLDDPSDREHLPNLSTMDGAKDMLSLYAIALFLNAFDDRTYKTPPISANQSHETLKKCQEFFDLNAIPVIERYHMCYTRGLALDLIRWFFNQYSFCSEDSSEELDGYRDVLVPFVVHVGRHIIRYKRAAVKCESSSASNLGQTESQVRSALFYQPHMREEHNNQVLVDREAGYSSDTSDSRDDPPQLYDLDVNMQLIRVEKRAIPINNGARPFDFLLEGQTLADQRFFSGLSCEFDIEKYGALIISPPLSFSFSPSPPFFFFFCRC